MNRFLLLFKVGIALAILITILGFSGCTKPDLALTGKPLDWKNATDVVPPEVIQSTLQTTSIPANQWASVTIRATKMQGKQNIIFLNFDQVPQLCGQLGCLAIALLEKNHVPIWQSYWNPNLPERTALLFQYDSQAMPAFVVNQLNGHHIQQVLHTWDGNQYHIEKVVLNE